MSHVPVDLDWRDYGDRKQTMMPLIHTFYFINAKLLFFQSRSIYPHIFLIQSLPNAHNEQGVTLQFAGTCQNTNKVNITPRDTVYSLYNGPYTIHVPRLLQLSQPRESVSHTLDNPQSSSFTAMLLNGGVAITAFSPASAHASNTCMVSCLQ